MASDIEVDQCLAALEVVYPNHFKAWTTIEQLTAARKLYHRIWRDIDGVLLEAAVTHWLSTARPFHPAPGELRDLALSMVTRNEPSADEAWIEVVDAMRKVGSYRTPQWSNDRIAQTVKAFGWYELCMTETDQLGFARAQFMKIYDAQMKREHDDRLMLPESRARVEALIGSTAKRLSGGGQ